MSVVRKSARNGVTEFQRRVYETVRRIPPGRVATYGGIAQAVGCGSARAVGQALRKNPFAPGVPCHRVIGSNLHVGGFLGWSGGVMVRRKLALLASEGVRFTGARLADRSRLWWPGRRGERPQVK